MNINFQEIIPEDFNNNSRVWIYQSNRNFSESEALQIEATLEDFSKTWHSHGSAVKSFAKLLYDRFIILMADESKVKVGGCSTDSAFRFIKNLEKEYKVSLLDRQTLAFLIDDKIHPIPLSKVNHSIEHETITLDTLYFNNTILSKKELLTQWIIPVKDSWLAQRFPASHYEKNN